MAKVLMLSSVASMIDQFNMANIRILQQLGHEVHVATNFARGSTSSPERLRQFIAELERDGIACHHVDLSRRTTDLRANAAAFRQIVALLRQTRFQFLHCHSPIGGVCGRLAGRLTRTPVIYTAHGFHFFDGAPWFNWLAYYPIERLLANYTDVLITINQEDYARARTFPAKAVVHVPGVGIDTAKLAQPVRGRAAIRAELGLGEDTFVLLSIGELTVRKNHATVLKALRKLGSAGVVYLICGRGELEGRLKESARQSGLADSVRFLGFRNDIADILSAADAFVFPSWQEGLSVALMEAMAAGLPVICSRIRGNTDLVEEGEGGFLIAPNDAAGFARRIGELRDDAERRARMAAHNRRRAHQHDVHVIDEFMRKIYAQMSPQRSQDDPRPAPALDGRG